MILPVDACEPVVLAGTRIVPTQEELFVMSFKFVGQVKICPAQQSKARVFSQQPNARSMGILTAIFWKGLVQ
jgi:hypothetical protein